MNRRLGTVLVVTAVVGATAGTVVATNLGVDEAGRGVTAEPTSGRSGVPSADGLGAGSPGGVLWANQRAIHDGDSEVPVQLLSPPDSLERAAGGWVVTVPYPGQDAEDVFFRDVSYVTPDGTVTPVTEIGGTGDVSPDGTRYTALMTGSDAYGVWEVATGTLVEQIDQGRDASLVPGTDGVQFIDDDTIAATWRSGRGTFEVDRHVLGERARPTRIAGGLTGPWAVSPDGRWIASTEPGTSDDGIDTCAVVTDLVDVVQSKKECGQRTYGEVTFSTDSSAVTTVPAQTDGLGPGLYHQVALDGGLFRPDVKSPDYAYVAAYVDETRMAMLGASTLDLDDTVVWLCDADGACEQVAESPDSSETAVLGTAD